MIEYDEFGNPLPPKWPPPDPYLDTLSAQTSPEGVQPPANPNTPPVADSAAPPEPYKIDPQSFLKKNYGINTMGPMADQAGETARNYNADRMAGEQLGVTYKDPSSGQTMNVPQQYGQDGGPADPDEGVISPKEAAERMPTSKDAMKDLVLKHLLPMHPALKKLGADGYQNHLTMTREKEAADKLARQQRGVANRADAASKDAAATQQMGGFNPYAAGSENGGGRVTNVGGYTFVKGQWRPQDSHEAAQTDYVRANTQNALSKPVLEAAEIATRAKIADGRLAADEANRGIRAQGVTEQNRHNTAVETQRVDEFKAKADEKTQKVIDSLTPQMESAFGDLTELEQFADMDDRPWYSHTPAEGQKDEWLEKRRDRNSTDWKGRADQIPVRDRQGNPTGKRTPTPGAHGALQRRLMDTVEKIVARTPEGEEPNIPQPIKDYLEPLFRERDLQKSFDKRITSHPVRSLRNLQ